MFGEMNLEQIFGILAPVADDVTSGGKVGDIRDGIGDRGAAIRIMGEELAEFGGAIEDLDRKGVSYDRIKAVVDQGADLPQAMKLLKDPSVFVELDGVQTTADDDAKPPEGDGDPDGE